MMLHDCLPYDEPTQRRERSTMFWTGDVWRVVVLLRRHRPDVQVEVLDVHGRIIVIGADGATEPHGHHHHHEGDHR